MFYNQHFITRLLSTALVSITLAAPLAVNASAVANDDANDRSFLFFGKKKNKKNAEATDSASTLSDYDSFSSDIDYRSEGLFNVLRKGENYYFEIPRKHLGKAMLVINKLVKVPAELNEAGANRGINYSNQLVKFELDSIAKKVIVRQFRPLPDIDPTHAMSKSVAENYISPIIASFKIETWANDSSAIVVKVNDIYDGTKTSFNDVFSDINIGTSPNTELSKINTIKAFENNIYTLSELTTRVSETTGTIYVTVEVGSTLLLLPEQPMTRRYASPRIGYFTDSNLRYSDDQQRVSRGHYITRWRLEPKPEDEADYLAGRLVEPAKPIVFWLDNSTPEIWRKHLRKGIEDWNEAFELAGFKNAIRVEQIPDSGDIDRDDVSYSVLTYAASEKSNAMGPSITDPRTGEILEADIIWWHNVVDLLHDWIVIQTGAVDPRVR